MGSSKKTVGYKYYMGVHAAICLGPVDEITQLTFDDRVGWTGSVTNNATIQVKQTELFGGESGQGGVLGDVDIMMGGPTQMPNAYLASRQGPESPGYRGFLSLVFRGTKVLGVLRDEVTRSFYWTANSPYIKPFGVKVRRVLKGWDGDTVWYAAKAAIGRNMNPAHIIYQCVTASWGMGRPASDIEDALWRETADQLHAEGFGLSLLWTREATIEEFIQVVVNHIGGSFYMNRSTGKFELMLVRDGYDVGTLPTLGPGSCQVDDFQRRAWGETTNQITVNYSDGASNDETSVTVHNVANIRQQGGNVVAQVVSYPGIRDGDLAYRVAQRDLMAASSPLATVKLTTDRRAWNWNPGDLFVLNWPALGIETLVLRVGKIGLGSLEQGRITIDAVEDVFGLPNNSYAASQPPLWQNPYADPVQITTYRMEEATYFDLAGELGEDAAASLPANVSRPQAICLSPATQNVSVDLVLVDELVGDGPYCDTAVLASALGLTDTLISYSGDTFFAELDAGSIFYLDNGLLAVESNDTTLKTITVKRGVLDTLPAAHAVGARLWLHNSTSAALDDTDRSAGATLTYKLQARGYANVVPLAGAPSASLTIPAAAGRHARPLPPACVKLNDQLFPDTVAGSFAITWSTRNRLLQTTEPFISWLDAASVAPEPDVTYTLEVYNADTNALIQRTTGLTGSSHRYRGGVVANMRVKLFSVRNGIPSWQAYEHTFELMGWGMNWGNDWSGSSYGSIVLPGELPPAVVADNASRVPAPYAYLDGAGGAAGAFGFYAPASPNILTPWLMHRYVGYPASVPAMAAQWADVSDAAFPFSGYLVDAVAAGDYGTTGVVVFMPSGVYTKDFQTYSASNFLAAPRFAPVSGTPSRYAFAYMNGQFVFSTGPDVLVSADGVTWTNVLGSSPTQNGLQAFQFTNGNFLTRFYYAFGKYHAVFDSSSASTGVVVASTDLINWSIVTNVSPGWHVHHITGTTYVAFEKVPGSDSSNTSGAESRFVVHRSTDNGVTFSLAATSLPDAIGFPTRAAPGQPFLTLGSRRFGWSNDGVSWSFSEHGLYLANETVAQAEQAGGSSARRVLPLAARDRLYVAAGDQRSTGGGRVYCFTAGSGNAVSVWPSTDNYRALVTPRDSIISAALSDGGRVATSQGSQFAAQAYRLDALSFVPPVGSTVRRYAEFKLDRLDTGGSLVVSGGDSYAEFGFLSAVSRLTGSTVYAALNSQGYVNASVQTNGLGKIFYAGSAVGVGLEYEGTSVTASFWVNGVLVGSIPLPSQTQEQLFVFSIKIFRGAASMRRPADVQYLPAGYTAI